MRDRAGEWDEWNVRRAREQELRRVAELIGIAYRDDPIVHASLTHILSGVPTEQVLVVAVQALAKMNERLLSDAMTIAASRSFQALIKATE